MPHPLISIYCKQVCNATLCVSNTVYMPSSITRFCSVLIASRMRGMVASVPFEQFHKYSTDIVRTAVFGKDKEGQMKKLLKFPANNLVSPALFPVILLFGDLASYDNYLSLKYQDIV